MCLDPARRAPFVGELDDFFRLRRRWPAVPRV